MKQSTYSPDGKAPCYAGKTGKQRALNTVEKARQAAALLEQVFRLMTEDDTLQPAVKYVYAALCEAEARAAVIEDWYERTYSEGSTI